MDKQQLRELAGKPWFEWKLEDWKLVADSLSALLEAADIGKDWDALCVELAKLYALHDDEWKDAPDNAVKEEFDPWDAIRVLSDVFAAQQAEVSRLDKAVLEAAERADTLPDIAAEVVKYHNEHVAPMVREEIGKIKKAAEAHRDRMEKALREIVDSFYFLEDHIHQDCVICRPAYEHRHEEDCPILAAERLIAAEALKEAGNGE